MRKPGMKSTWLAVGLAACGADDTTEDPVDCEKEQREGRAETFVAGIEHPGKDGVYNLKIVSSMPAPPMRGNNTWVVQVNQLNAGVVGAPVDGATLKITPFMPEHGHGTAVPIEITPMTEPGQYKADPVNMWMQGVWEVTVRSTVEPATDSTVFKFCMP